MEMGRPRGKGRAAKTGKSKGGAGRQRENWATEEWMGRHVQQCNRTVVKNTHKTGGKRVYSHNNKEHAHNRVHSQNNREHSHNNRVHSHNTEHTTFEYTQTLTQQ